MKELAKYLTKELSKSPGWLPLSVITFWYLKPLLVQLNNVIVSTHVDAITIGLIAFLFLLGEMIDNISFPRNDNHGWEILRKRKVFVSMSDIRSRVRSTLGFSSGVYKLAKELVAANSKTFGIKYYLVEMINNTSKLFRSLIVPSFAIGLYYCFNEDILRALIFILSGVALFIFYYFLKAKHMYLYYKYCYQMLSSASFERATFEDNQNKKFEMIFWKKKLMYSRLKNDVSI